MILALVVVIAAVAGFFMWTKAKSNNQPKEVLQRVVQQWGTLQTNIRDLNTAGAQCLDDYKQLKTEAERLESSNIPDAELLAEARNSIGPILTKFKADIEKAEAAYAQTEKSIETLLQTLEETKAHPEDFKEYAGDLKKMEEVVRSYQSELPRAKDTLQQLSKVRQNVQNLLDNGGTAQAPGNPAIHSASVLNVLKSAEVTLPK